MDLSQVVRETNKKLDGCFDAAGAVLPWAVTALAARPAATRPLNSRRRCCAAVLVLQSRCCAAGRGDYAVATQRVVATSNHCIGMGDDETAALHRITGYVRDTYPIGTPYPSRI